jgi:hypothetical protein
MNKGKNPSALGSLMGADACELTPKPIAIEDCPTRIGNPEHLREFLEHVTMV